MSVFRPTSALGAAGFVLCASALVACGSDTSDPGTGAAVPGSTQTPATAGTTAPAPTTGAAGSAAGSRASGSGAAGTSAASVGTAGVSAAIAGTSGAAAGASGAAAAAGGSAVPDGATAGAGGAAGTAAGSGGAGGASGGASAAGSVAAGSGGSSAGAGAVEQPHEDEGEGDGSDVIIMGDSYMSNTLQIEGTGGGIVPSLLQASGQRYRNYAVQGTMLLMDDSFGPAIPTQWDDAKRANPKILTVIMSGGGNDIIQSDALKASCMMGGDECKDLLMRETKAFDALWTKMAEAGVLDIIHVGYATDGGTVDPSALPAAGTPAICTTGKVRCHDLDTTALIMKEIAADGIHPMKSANDRVAKAIVDLMEKEGIRR